MHKVLSRVLHVVLYRQGGPPPIDAEVSPRFHPQVISQARMLARGIEVIVRVRAVRNQIVVDIRRLGIVLDAQPTVSGPVVILHHDNPYGFDMVVLYRIR